MNDNNQTLCEKLLLLLLERDGKLISGSTTGYLLAGALLADLVLRGRVDIAGQGKPVKDGRVLVLSAAPTGDALLDAALERVQRKQGARPSSVIGPLSKGTRPAVLERLTSAGTIGESSRKVIGCSRSGHGRLWTGGPRSAPGGPFVMWSSTGCGPNPRPPC